MPIKKTKETIILKEKQRKIKKEKAQKKKVILSICILIGLVLIAFFIWPKSHLLMDKYIAKNNGASIKEIPLVKLQSENGVQLWIEHASIHFEMVEGREVLKVKIDKISGSQDREINYKYEWMVNDNPAGDGGNTLKDFKRGDKISVKITPTSGDIIGSARTFAVYVQNAAPIVSVEKPGSFSNKTFAMKLKSADSDGDQLTYGLASGPDGMVVDEKTGAISWPYGDKEGIYPAVVKISDGHGGETTYQFTVTIPKRNL